jgi:hypothetical protein
VYWRPIDQLLEGQCTLLVANAPHIKRMPGRKTEATDAERRADLLRHGLIAPSFVRGRPHSANCASRPAIAAT